MIPTGFVQTHGYIGTVGLARGPGSQGGDHEEHSDRELQSEGSFSRGSSVVVRSAKRHCRHYVVPISELCPVA